MHWNDDVFGPGSSAGGFRPEAVRGALSVRPPATGGWREGDHPGDRLFQQLGAFEFEHGGEVPLRMAYETWGELNDARDNAVLVLHALTGDSHVDGPAGPGHATAGWWPGLIGEELPLDTERWFVVAPSILGGCQGTTGPASIGPDGREYGARFPLTTIRDQVRAQALLADRLGIDRFAAVIGGSMGGMHALEWAAMMPERVARLAVLSAPPVIDAMTIAQNTLQADAIRLDPAWRDGDYYDAAAGEGPWRGLALARRLAMLNYRSVSELDDRFGRSWQSSLSPALGAGRYAVESYLDFHGNRFTRRFDANSYITLIQAMNTHDLGRDRGGVDAALGGLRMPTLVVAIDTDALFLPATQHRIARFAPGSITGDEAFEIVSPYGHDGFLIEMRAVGDALRRLLAAD